MSVAEVSTDVRGRYDWDFSSMSRVAAKRLDDAVGHQAVSYRSYSMVSRKLSTRCLSSFAALSS